MYYLVLFFLYSIIGWIFETLLALITNVDYNSGIMYGPWTPVYGISILIMILIWRKRLQNIQHNKILKSVLFFFISALVLSILELVSGLVIEFFTGIVYWDYSKTFPFHIGKFISLEVGMIWGLLSLITIWLINPKIERIVPKIPKFIIYIFYSIFSIDLIVTILTKFI